MNADDRAKILALINEGRSRAEIARAVGVTPSQVSAVVAHRTMGTYGPLTPPSVPTPALPVPPSDGRLRIPLGTDVSTSEAVSWDLSSTANPHLLIVGESGFGKTYSIQCILSELALRGVGTVIFDFAHGFTKTMVARAQILDLGRRGLALNPFAIHATDLHGPVSVAQRVADSFARVYPRLGIQQHAVLRSAIIDVFTNAGIGDDPDTWLKAPPTLSALEEKLRDYVNHSDSATKRTAATVASHVSTLFVFNIFRDNGTKVDWGTLFSQTTILHFSGLESAVSKLVTEFLLWSLIQYAESTGPQQLRGLLVLDEAHRLSFDDGSPVERLLREARKFGVGLIIASQQPEDFTNVAISNTATKLVFQVTDSQARFARMLSRKARSFAWPEVADLITRLPRGQAYFLSGNSACVVSISPLETRPTRSVNKRTFDDL